MEALTSDVLGKPATSSTILLCIEKP